MGFIAQNKGESLVVQQLATKVKNTIENPKLDLDVE
jgi:hypothetical protein